MDQLSPEHKLLRMIGREAGRNQKIKMLDHFKQSNKLKNIFLYSLDPFRKYFIKQFPNNNNEALGQGSCVIDDLTWRILDRLATREVTGRDAKIILFGHLRDLTPSEADLLKKIILHKLDIGVSVGTVNQVWPKLIEERFVQKAEDYDQGQLVLPSYAGIKLDGIRADYKDRIFTSRSGHPVSGLDHIADDIDAKGGGHWDGEIIVPKLAHNFDLVSGYIRSGLTCKLHARYVIFDNLTIATLKQSIRLQSLQKFDRYRVSGRHNNPAVTYLEHTLLKTEEDIMSYFSLCLNAGQEGVMVKHPRARYRAGRTYNWMKLKKGESEEFEIVDYYPGEGKYQGTLGGLIVSVDGVHVRVGSGFSDKERNDVWALLATDKTQVLGRLATINYMQRTADGSLRHPIFKNVRWDI